MRRGVFLLATIGAAFLVAGGLALVSSVGLGRSSVAEAQTSTTENPQPDTATGVFHVQWGDPPRRDPNAGSKTEYVLIDDRGREKKLLLDKRDTEAAGGPLAFKGKRVKVRGNRVSNEAEQVDVQAIEFERPEDAAEAKSKVAAGEPAAQALTSESVTSESKPWVTIGCRFKDYSTVTPKQMSYFEGLMGASTPGIDHYWQELSFGTTNLTGSKVVGWYNLPRNRRDYVRNGNPDLTRIANDCTAVADAAVRFPDFFGINLVLNKDIGSSAWGGSRTLSRDGQTKNYGVTWLPDFAYGHDWVTHEMGHGFGMPHSSGPYSATYDSEWDVMSGAGLCGADPNGTNPLSSSSWAKHDPYECIADHTISYHKDLVGWIPPERKYKATSGPNPPITIERLGQGLPASTSGYLMAQIPIKGSNTQFYTVESRRSAGYDDHVNGRIPGEAIVIHKVDTALSSRPARVIDVDAVSNTNPNDAGAMWLPDPGNDPSKGEIFQDTANGIKVQVTEKTASGYKVQITVS